MGQNRKRFYFLKNFLRCSHVVQNVMWGPPWALCTFVFPCPDGGRADQPGGLPVWGLLQDPGAALSAVCCGIAAAAAGRGAPNSPTDNTYTHFPQGRWISWLQSCDCKLVHGPFYINIFLYTSEITRWIKPDGWIHWSVWTDHHIPAIHTVSFGPKDVLASSCH